MLKLKVKATGNNLLFLSEVYYPFWKAFIGEKELPIYKTNYAFRAVLVPQGEHEIEFRFESPAFETGKTYSMLANVIVVLALALGLFLNYRERKAVKPTDESA
jgi:uncharacterized membrane protein YfhO